MSTAPQAEVAAQPGLVTCAAIAAVLQGAFLFGEAFRIDEGLTFADWWMYVAVKGDQLLRVLLTLPVFALTLQAAARLPWIGARRLGAMTALLLGCALLSTLLMVSLPYRPLHISIGASASMEAYFWYEVWANFVVAVLAQLSVSHLRERGEAVERLAQAQDRGLAARQQLARAQLQAIQARVDPQLLFETLKAVKRFYQHETERAERLLDELAAFLRAALPRLRSTRSTLELEFQMVASYARLQQIGFDRPVALHVDLPSELVNEGFPAGLLLPLSISLLEGQAEPRIELAASADEQRLRVSVLVNAAPADAAWERLAAALHDLYGGRATCRQVPAFPPRPSAADVNLELEVPREPA